jgi:hypothetical protein
MPIDLNRGSAAPYFWATWALRPLGHWPETQFLVSLE